MTARRVAFISNREERAESVVSRRQRLAELRRLGVSESVVQLAAGKNRRAAFRFHCGIPWKSYRGAGAPAGELVIPMWECGDSVTALRTNRGKVEFVTFSVESPKKVWDVVRSEQALLAHLFIELYEDADEDEERRLAADARSVGFRYFRELVSAYSKSKHTTSNQHTAFVRRFVGSIEDREV